MKHRLSILLTLAIFLFAACGNNSTDAISENGDKDNVTQTETQGINNSAEEDIVLPDANEHESRNFYYIICNDGTAEITKYVGDDSSIDIPSTLDGYTVSKISNSAFENNDKLQKVYIYGGAIGDSAFKNCSNLTFLWISDKVTSIGTSSYENCTSLRDVYIGGGDIERNAFKNCTSIERIDLHGGVIGECAFADCASLAYLWVSGDVISIGASAFANCTNLEDIYINSSETIIDPTAFTNCPGFDG